MTETSKISLTSKNSLSLQFAGALVFTFALIFANSTPGFAQQEPRPSAKAEQEIILIETKAKRPGPPLWQVSNGRNVVWIFGIPSPYHKDDLNWDRSSVRSIMAESDIFIPAPERKMPANPIKLALVLKQVARLMYMPDKGDLKDVVSPELYERYLAVKAEYWPKNKRALKYRPHTAGLNVYGAASRSAGLVPGVGDGRRSKISKTIERIARSKSVKFKTMHATWHAEGFKEVVDNMVWDIDCLEAALDSRDSDIEGMVSRSHAWAEGDVSAYREYNYPHVELACIPDVPQGDNALVEELNELQSLWLEAIEEAMAAYENTFSTMSIDDLVRPGGLLEALVRKGYSVRIL